MEGINAYLLCCVVRQALLKDEFMNLLSPTQPRPPSPHPRLNSGHPHDPVPCQRGMAGIFHTHAVASLLWAGGRGVSSPLPADCVVNGTHLPADVNVRHQLGRHCSALTHAFTPHDIPHTLIAPTENRWRVKKNPKTKTEQQSVQQWQQQHPGTKGQILKALR